MLHGVSIARFLFEHAERDRVYGPLRTPDGYVLVRVTARTLAKTAPALDDERTRARVRRDYLTGRFLEFANQALVRTKVE